MSYTSTSRPWPWPCPLSLLRCKKRVHSQLCSASFFRCYELFDGKQAHLGFVTVTDTQHVALQGVQRRDSLWTTWEVERHRLPSSSSCSTDAAVLPGSAGFITAVHNLVIRLRGRPGDVNASDYTRKMLVDWYLIALPHLAAHSVAAVREPQRPGRLQLGV